MAFATHDDYFASVAADIRPRLAAIQATVESLLPEATRCIGYSMPAYRGRRIFFYFAAFTKHIGIYPPIKKDTRLIEELRRYRGAKGNLSFSHGEPLPIDLIGRVAVALHREYEQR